MSERRLEFWPDYSGALLHENGIVVSLEALPLARAERDRAATWVDQYDDSTLPWESADGEWLAEGRALFAILRDSLARHGIVVFDWEGLWDRTG
jgi:hypothetical protein